MVVADSAAVTVVVVATVVTADVDFYFYEFQKYISDENKIINRVASGSNAGNGTGFDVAHLRRCARGADFQFTNRRRQRAGGGSHKS
jgi:hypothetical protein